VIIWAKSLKIQAKSMEICEKFCKIPEDLGKNDESFVKFCPNIP